MSLRPTYDQIIEAVNLAGGYRGAERSLREQGYAISDRQIRRLIKVDTGSAEFELEEPLIPEVDVEELIERRIREYETKKAAAEQQKLIQVRVNREGPIGLAFQGDLHLDDDGTDLAQVFEHLTVLDGSVPGLYAANLGDILNNWVGRLEKLHANQSITNREALVLSKRVLNSVNWLFFIMGNHDCWRNGVDLYEEMLAKASMITRSDRIRVALRLPNGRNVKIYAAHGFRGRSMWSEVFGAAKKAQLMGVHDIYVCGHWHTSGYTHGIHPGTEQMWHAIQVASYKRQDSYADTLVLEDHWIYNCPVALIDPNATDPVNFIRWEFDPLEAAERLKWMQSRHARQLSAS